MIVSLQASSAMTGSCKRTCSDQLGAVGGEVGASIGGSGGGSGSGTGTGSNSGCSLVLVQRRRRSMLVSPSELDRRRRGLRRNWTYNTCKYEDVPSESSSAAGGVHLELSGLLSPSSSSTGVHRHRSSSSGVHHHLQQQQPRRSFLVAASTDTPSKSPSSALVQLLPAAVASPAALVGDGVGGGLVPGPVCSEREAMLASGKPHDCGASGCQRVVINVSGQRYETQLRTLDRFPETLLGHPLRRRRYWDTRRNEFFIDRHRPSFQAVLYYYQSGGRLRRPIEVPEDVFLEELVFYQISEETIREYKERDGFLMEKKKALPAKAWKRKLWLFCEEPDSSKAAKVFALLSVFCIMVAIVSFCMETLPAFDRPICVNTTDDGRTFYERPNYRDPFFIVETVCVVWFTVEFLLRFASCPSRRHFSKNLMNIFDVLAILPFFVVLAIQQTEGNCESAKKSGSFTIVRVLRVFRIFKLSKHSRGLRILGMTIKTSLHELGMFFFFLLVAMVIFSSAAYYAEAGEEKTQLTSIPGAFWWAIVTMTTVGYGDVTPVGVWGKMVGTLCVVAGVLTIALPVPVVVSNFNNFYRHENGRGYISA